MAFERVLNPVIRPSGARGGFCPRPLFGFYERGIGSGHGEIGGAVRVICDSFRIFDLKCCGSARGLYCTALTGVFSVTFRYLIIYELRIFGNSAIGGPLDSTARPLIDNSPSSLPYPPPILRLIPLNNDPQIHHNG